MDLVKLIDEQFSGDVLGKLSSLLNTDSQTARKATSAAVPAILSALSGLAASEDSAHKLASTLGSLDNSHLGNMAQALSGDTGSFLQKGGSMLSSLFGDSLVANIAGAVGRYTHLDAGAIMKLLSALAPTILGVVAGQWKGLGGNLHALSGLFADQKQNIAKAVPGGFSLANIPGLASANEALRGAGDNARAAGYATPDLARRAAGAAENTTRSLLNWILPLAALLLIAFALWSFFRSNAGPAAANAAKNEANVHTVMKPELPAVPDAAAVSENLTGVFASATQTLSGIGDATSVASALPKLTELSGKIDGIRNVFDKLPEAGQAALGQIIGKQMAGFKEQAAKILAIPGVGEQLKPALDEITTKLAALNVAQVSQDATDIFASLTKTLGNFKDLAAAEANAPQLQQVATKIDQLKQTQASMSPGGQSTLAKIVAAARGPLDQLIAKVLVQLGPNASGIKSILDQIVGTLARLAEPTTST
jgi:cytochrome c556